MRQAGHQGELPGLCTVHWTPNKQKPDWEGEHPVTASVGSCLPVFTSAIRAIVSARSDPTPDISPARVVSLANQTLPLPSIFS